MKWSSSWIVATVWSVTLLEPAQGQTLLERLGQQLQTLTPPASEPAAVPENRTTPAAPATPSPMVVDGRPSLGIHVGPITDELQRTQRLAVRRGAVVASVERGSPAERAGLPVGAIIVAFDGRRIDRPEDLIDAVQQSRPGQEVELTYYDRDRLSRKRLSLGNAPAGFLPPTGPARPLPAPAPAAVPAPAIATPPGSTAEGRPFERQLGAGGNRPLLGRIGRALDTLVAPAQAVVPTPGDVPAPGTAAVPALEPIAPAPGEAAAGSVVTNRIPAGGALDSEVELTELRRQVLTLSRELESLRRQVHALQKQVDGQSGRQQ